ncbi:hypothetical protein METHP14_10312 [Pseudomonas sp. P14-2025]
MEGLVRLTAPVAFARQHLAGFLALYPRVRGTWMPRMR